MRFYRKITESITVRPALVMLFLALFLGGAHHASAVGQISTRYYTIVYEEGGEYVAGEIAKFCDEIYEQLMARYHAFNGNPRVTCIVTDDADFSNGFAQYYQNTITIYATTMDFELRGQTNWLRNVFVHEMTHMIALKKAAKGPVNFVALSAGRYDHNPDFDINFALYHLSQPLWFVEGSAQTGAESFGAERWDTHRDMLLRSAWYEKSLLSLDEMDVLSGKKGMDAEMVYNQGYSLVRYIKEKYGYDKVVQLNNTRTYSDFDPTLQRVLGVKPQALYTDWKAMLDSRYASFRDRTFIEGEKTVDTGSMDYRPAISPDGRYLVWLSNRGKDYAITDLLLKDLTTGKQQVIAKNVDYSAAWSHDSRRIVYSRRPAPGSRFYDIFIFDVASGMEERISKNLRARDPNFSPSDSLVVFVHNEGGNNALGVIGSDGVGLRYLTSTHDGTQFYAPSYSPDGSTILFGLFRQDKDRDIALLKPGTKTWRYTWDRADSTKGFPDSTCFASDAELKILLGTSHDERDPQFLPDGKGIVYSSDQNGIFNIYTMDIASGHAKRMTDVCGGAFCPSVGSDGDIWYTGYRARDFSIYRLRNPQSVEEITPVSESRNYLAQLPKFDLSKNFTQQPFQTKRLINAIVPTVTVGPSFIGSRFGLNVVDVGAQVYISDVLGQDALSVSGSVGKNLKERVSLNNNAEIYYERRMAPLTSSTYTHSPSIYVGASRTVINNLIGRFDGTADTLLYGDISGTSYKNVLQDRVEHYTVDDLYQDEFRRYRAGLQIPLAARHFLLLEASYRQYYESLLRQEKLKDLSHYILNGNDITSSIPGAGSTATADTRYFSDMQYFNAAEIGFTYIYYHPTPAADDDISPRGTTALFQFRHMRTQVTDSLVTQPKYYVPTAIIGQDANGNLVFSYGTYNPDDLLDVLRPFRKTTDLNEYTMYYNGNYRLPIVKHDLGSMFMVGYRDLRLDDYLKGEGNGYNWPLKYYLGGDYSLSGYPYFAFWGSKVFLGRLNYTFPIIQKMGRTFCGVHFQRLYGSAFFEAGSTWNFSNLSYNKIREGTIKRDVGVELRLKTIFFYRLDGLAYFKMAWPLDDMGGSPYENDARRYYFGLRM